MPSRQITDLCETLQPTCVQFLALCNGDPVFVKAGAEVFITCTYRSGVEQDAEYAKGRTAAGVPCSCGGRSNRVGTCQKHPFGLTVTKAKAGESPHNVTEGQKPAARAFDFAVRLSTGKADWDASDALWRRAIAIGKGLGMDSGSRFGDSPHMQLMNWKA